MKPIQAAFLSASLVLLASPLLAEDLTVLGDASGDNPPGKDLEIYLEKEFHAHLDRRRAAFEALDSQAACREWAESRRRFFLDSIGGLPERTPLNARTVSAREGDGYRVETILLESRPGFHVTANLYLPEGEGPFPAVLIPCGHSHNGKAADGYQRASILHAQNGMAALCYDPVGQGERYQMLDFEEEHEFFASVSYELPVPHPRVRYLCTVEHTAMGLGCILLGTNIAQYRIWDGMRCIDYLQERDDILADRIGCTGNSGGGTLTAYLMALDDRIVAAAPACYLTTFRKLIETKGAQDAEQNLFGQIAFGLDEPDYAMMRAPRPTLVLAGTRDATFDIEGTWDLFRQAKRFYSRLGFPERVDINEADAPHGFYLQQREAAARWMHRWLLDEDKVIREVDPWPDPLPDTTLRELSEGDWTQEELYATPEGQVLLMDGSKSVFQLNAEAESALREKRGKTWASLDVEARRSLVRETIGAARSGGDDASPRPARWERVGTVPRDGYAIEKVVLHPEPGIRLPALVFVPGRPNGSTTLYLHGESMKTDAAPGGPIERLARGGTTVVAAELRGIGETETGHDKRDYGRGKFGRDVQEIFLAYLIGRSYVGMRVEDVASWTDFAAAFGGENAPAPDRPLDLVAVGEAAIPALHAAAIAPDRFGAVTLRGMIPSWAEVVATPGGLNQAANVVHGALRHYDLSDLVEMAGSAKVTLAEPVDTFGQAK